MAGGRDERVVDLFFEEADSDPDEEGLVRRRGTDLKIYLDGSVQSLLTGTGVPPSRQIIAGAGLTGGGDLSADRTINVVANADGSITVNADDIRVGILASDAQHGTRGGGTQHAAVTGSVNGFMSSGDKSKLDGIEAGAQVNVVTSVFGRVGAVTPQTSDYDADQVDFSPDGDIVATEVQAAIVEVRDDTDTKLTAKVDKTTQVNAGAGLTGGGDLSVSRTLNVAAADGSITVNADDIQVGVINDTQHGSRGGGSLHALATQSVAGFMSAADKTTIDGLGVFGQEFNYEQESSEDTTTSGTYQNKLQLVTTALPSGDYLLTYSYVVGGSKNSTKIQSRVTRNGGDVVELTQAAASAGNRIAVSGVEVLLGISGAQTLEIDWRKSGGSGTASISNAHLVLWRIE